MISDLKAGLNLAKGVVDLAKGLKDLSDKSNDIDIRDAAVELRSKTIDLKVIVNDMRDRIIELEEQLEFSEKLDFNGKVFFYSYKDSIRYICNGCISDGKHVHMSETRLQNGAYYVSCPVCNNKQALEEGSPIVRKVNRRKGGSKDSWMG